MELSQFTDYSLRTLMYLAMQENRELVSINEISDAYQISKNHLVKVVHNLAKLNYVETYRGRGGGIALALEPKEINIGALVRKTENLGLVECFDGRQGTCCLDGSCQLKHLLHRASLAFLAELDRQTLADITEHKADLKQLLGIPK